MQTGERCNFLYADKLAMSESYSTQKILALTDLVPTPFFGSDYEDCYWAFSFTPKFVCEGMIGYRGS